MTTPVLRTEQLRITLPGGLTAVDGVDLVVEPGQIVGLAGESGSGKSLTALSLFGLLPHGSRAQGRAEVGGRDVLTLREKQLRAMRGDEVAMVFQDPMTSLHPMLTIGRQVTEHLRHHHGTGRSAARARAVELLTQVRIPDPERTLGAYPHQLSGGMRQRAAIAIALACSPSLLVADEPTTALDVTVQAGILRLLDRLRREEGLSILLITHDLGVMGALTDRLAVMYAGRIVETGPTQALLTAPRHPYTRGLLDSLPRTDGVAAPLRAIPGSAPRLTTIPPGCAFHPRCGHAVAPCSTDRPSLLPLASGAPRDEGRMLACLVDPYAAAGERPGGGAVSPT
ncbi:oligopeptide transporter ATP-binding component [Humibacillus sp. DSM 29435]|uniref:ABC transporter ATP-binding protein n=1 Tax=Humibacillus sp. DSM 29435 TaxID=1869167 RepID=UPI0008727AFF|nr:ABC transporter ATP-binding protein [Humibacillus sp. DSM 29435]OFE16018.1 oligopeptide transporter ATP-binding component [Humibacillus sp. DSM 29435]